MMLDAADTLRNIVTLSNLGLHASIDMLSGFCASTPEITLRHAQACVQLGNYAQASRLIRGLRPYVNHECFEVLLQCMISTRKTGLLSKLIDEIVAFGTTPKLHLLMGKALLVQYPEAKGQHPAIPHFIVVLREYPYAVELYELLLDLGVDVGFVLQALGEGNVLGDFLSALRQASKGLFEAALERLLSVAQKLPDAVAVWCRVAECAFEGGDWLAFDTAVAQIPDDDLRVIDLRASRLRSRKCRGELIAMSKCALVENDAGNPMSWLCYSQLLELQGDHSYALAAAKKSSKLNRRCYRGFLRQAELHVIRGDIQKAFDFYKRAHDLRRTTATFKGLVQSAVGLANNPLADAYAVQCSQVLEGPVVHLIVGMACKERDKASCIALMERALSLRPGWPEALEVLVDALIADGSLDRAEAALKQQGGEGAFYWCRLGQIALERGDLISALDSALRACACDSEYRPALDLRDSVEERMRSGS